MGLHAYVLQRIRPTEIILSSESAALLLLNCDAKLRNLKAETKEETTPQLSSFFHPDTQRNTTIKRKHYEHQYNWRPRTGNTYQEVHIDYVQNYVPNATTVVNHNYGDRQKSAPASDKPLKDEEREARKADIIDYVSRLSRYLARMEEPISLHMAEDTRPARCGGKGLRPRRQQGTHFNRNLVAHIIYIMCKASVFTTNNATAFAEALEDNKEHSVRNQLGSPPDDRFIKEQVEDLLHG